jgi:hypothetical protein
MGDPLAARVHSRRKLECRPGVRSHRTREALRRVEIAYRVAQNEIPASSQASAGLRSSRSLKPDTAATRWLPFTAVITDATASPCRIPDPSDVYDGRISRLKIHL